MNKVSGSSGKKSDRLPNKERKSKVRKSWERLLSNKDSRNLLKEVWKSNTPIKEYSEKINKFHKKYCN